MTVFTEIGINRAFIGEGKVFSLKPFPASQFFPDFQKPLCQNLSEVRGPSFVVGGIWPAQKQTVRVISRFQHNILHTFHNQLIIVIPE